MIRCGVCRREFPYEKTGLAEWEARLRLAGTRYREGWTRHVRNEWACEACVQQGRALRADPARQDAGLRGPFLAWWDQERICAYCGGTYLFSAREQKRWYEERGLSLKVRPIACLPCRKAVAAWKRAQKSLAERLAVLDPEDAAALEEVGELELRAGSVAKGLEYLRRARRRSAHPERLQARIAQVEAEGVPPPPSTHWGRFRAAWDGLEQAR